MNAEDKVGDYLERGPAAGEAEGPDGAVHVRRVLDSDSVWGDPPPGVLDGVLGQIRAERTTASTPASTASTPASTPAETAAGTPVGTHAGMPAVAPAEASGGARTRRRPGRLLLVAAAVVLLALGGLAGWLAAGWTPTPDVVRAELAGTEFAPGASGVANVRDTPSGVAISLDVSGLPPAAPGTYYAGWVKAPDGQRVAIGTFHLRGGEETIELWAGVDVARYSTLTVTVQEERAGEQPPGNVVLKGSIPAP